jgi:hypothetical protein
VDRVQSPKLAAMLKNIVKRLKDALRSAVDRLMNEVGRPLARKLAYLAVSLGNQNALNWAFDTKFAKYLTIMHMNDPEMYKA